MTTTSRFNYGDRVVLTRDFEFVKQGTAGLIVASKFCGGSWIVELDVLPGLQIPESICARS